MKISSMAAWICVFGLAFSAAGCGKKKAEAQAEYAKIEEACKAGDKDKAKDIALKARESNEVFKAAFDGATDTVSDKTKVNICGALVQSELKMRIEHN